jgi:hypothetical protein
MFPDTVLEPSQCGSISSWLVAEVAARALKFAQASCDQFKVSDVGYKERNRIDLSYRRSSKLKPIGELETEVEADVRTALPCMFDRLGLSRSSRLGSNWKWSPTATARFFRGMKT